MSAGAHVTPTRSNPVAGLFKIEGTATALVFLVLIVVFMITAPRAFLGYHVYMSFMASVPPPLIIALGEHRKVQSASLPRKRERESRLLTSLVRHPFHIAERALPYFENNTVISLS